MDIITLASIVIGSFVSIGVLIAGAGYGYAQWKKGGKSLVQEDLKIYIDQVDGMAKIIAEQKEQIKDLQNDVKGHTSEIGRLNGIIEEKERKVKELTDLLANRDPALGEHIKFSREAIGSFKESVERVHMRLDQIQNQVNSIAEAKLKSN